MVGKRGMGLHAGWLDEVMHPLCRKISFDNALPVDGHVHEVNYPLNLTH